MHDENGRGRRSSQTENCNFLFGAIQSRRRSGIFFLSTALHFGLEATSAQFGRLPLYSSLCSMDENVSSLRPQTESEGRNDGRKERSNYTEQSARINSHHSRTLISICGRPRGCQSIMDWGNISTQDLSSYLYFLRIH